MLPARLAAAVLAALALAPAAPAAGPAPVSAAPAAPQNLKAFLLRADEPALHSFPRTPSFAWKPVPAAQRYEFELSTSKVFASNAIIWSDDKLTTPAVSIPLALPWITGAPYSLYAHVRAVTAKRVSPWSAPYGFNMRWPNIPAPLPSGTGYVRWSPVEGATSYNVWFTDAGKIFTAVTNVADEREHYTFHQGAAWTGVVHWRVRAVRILYGAPVNGLPAVSYGPWSPIYTATNPFFTAGPLTLLGTASDVVGNALEAKAHRLMPAFLYSGNEWTLGSATELYRVYVFTDSDCINVVYRGAIVGSPAYAPRPTGPLALPHGDAAITAARAAFLPDGTEGATFTFDGVRVTTSESASGEAESSAGAGGSSGGGSGTGGGASATTGGQAGEGTSLPADQTVTGARVDLWDTDWPTGRYYWTVVPVIAVPSPPLTTTLTSAAAAGATTITVSNPSGFAAGDALLLGPGPSPERVTIISIAGSTITIGSGLATGHAPGESVVRPGGQLEYRDAELTQEACADRVLTFGKSSQPVVTTSGAPFASGLSPSGRLVAAAGSRPAFYGPPLVAWRPALGASQYEVQWSKTRYPWQTAGSALTFATSVVLGSAESPLEPGTWYYRVRGINFSLPGKAQQMSWSKPVALVVAKPQFAVVRG